MYKILFICTDNVGRSLTAEYLLRDILKKADRRDIIVSSAGICADSDVSSFCFAHLDELEKMGIDASGHERRQLTGEILERADLALVMDEEQRIWVKKNLGKTVMLYNKFYKDQSTSVSFSGMSGTSEEKCLKIVEYFRDSLPSVLEKIDKMLHSADSGSSSG